MTACAEAMDNVDTSYLHPTSYQGHSAKEDAPDGYCASTAVGSTRSSVSYAMIPAP